MDVERFSRTSLVRIEEEPIPPAPKNSGHGSSPLSQSLFAAPMMSRRDQPPTLTRPIRRRHGISAGRIQPARQYARPEGPLVRRFRNGELEFQAELCSVSCVLSMALDRPQHISPAVRRQHVVASETTYHTFCWRPSWNALTTPWRTSPTARRTIGLRSSTNPVDFWTTALSVHLQHQRNDLSGFYRPSSLRVFFILAVFDQKPICDLRSRRTCIRRGWKLIPEDLGLFGHTTTGPEPLNIPHQRRGNSFRCR